MTMEGYRKKVGAWLRRSSYPQKKALIEMKLKDLRSAHADFGSGVFVSVNEAVEKTKQFMSHGSARSSMHYVKTRIIPNEIFDQVET